MTNICGNFTNTVTATGLSPCNTSVRTIVVSPAEHHAAVEIAKQQIRDGEAFHQWARRLPNAELRATLQERRP